MCTTLDIDEDVLEAAKEPAARRRTTAGRVNSELVRSPLAPANMAQGSDMAFPAADSKTDGASHFPDRESTAGRGARSGRGFNSGTVITVP